VIKLPQQYLSNDLYRSLTGNVLYKLVQKGISTRRKIIISWIDIRCDKCKRFISRKRLKHKTNDGLILCERCANKHFIGWYKIYEKERHRRK